MKVAATVLPVLALLASAISPVNAIPWPIPPVDSVQPLFNNWGNFQTWMTFTLFHDGIDVMTPGRQHAPVVSVSHGWVKAVGTVGMPMHFRIAVSDSGPDCTGRAPGWLYAHLDESYPHRSVGDEVSVGDTIGYLYPMGNGYDHLHFSRISDTGATWQRFPNTTWWYTENPLLTLEPNTDTVAPVFEDARPGMRFAFCRDNSSDYLNPDSIAGEIDIIARIYDETGCRAANPAWDRLAPFEVNYCIEDETGVIVVPWTIAVQFSNRLEADNILVVYKNDNVCRSRGSMDIRDYYYIVTNTDGDSIIEPGDAAGMWDTSQMPDGNYRILVRASDVCGNNTADSMTVAVRNLAAIEHSSRPALLRPLQVCPSPGRGPALVRFTLGGAATARLRIIDRSGRVTRWLADCRLEPGPHEFQARGLAAGSYLVELTLMPGQNDAARHSAKLVVTR